MFGGAPGYNAKINSWKWSARRLLFVRHEPICSYYRQAGANRIFFL